LRKAKIKGLRNEAGYLIRKVGELALRKAKKRETAANGGSRQRVVVEEELEAFLEEGWRVEAVLPSGRIVIAAE